MPTASHGWRPLFLALVLVAWSPPARAVPIADIQGTYLGAWNNTTFGTTGSALIDIQFVGMDFSLTIDLGGNVFGLFDPPPSNFMGTLTAGCDVIILGSTAIGDVDGFYEGSTGAFDIAVTNFPPPADFVEELSFVGTIGGGVIALDYNIALPGAPTFAQGVLTAQIPEPAPALLIASLLLALATSGRRPRA